MECRDLLLVGMATSTNLSEASVSQNAMTLGVYRQFRDNMGRVGVDARDVDIGSFSDSLVVDTRVGHDDDPWFLE